MIMCGSCMEGPGGAIVTRREAYRPRKRTMGHPPAQHRVSTWTGWVGEGRGARRRQKKLVVIWDTPCPCSETTTCHPASARSFSEDTSFDRLSGKDPTHTAQLDPQRFSQGKQTPPSPPPSPSPSPAMYRTLGRHVRFRSYLNGSRCPKKAPCRRYLPGAASHLGAGYGFRPGRGLPSAPSRT